ncbi:MAG: TonB-dependent receptor plug domain-containing protein, partial [Gemmatimonadetes bacterium]|nr:TonB-dependent receptor plug domain-containing protein [Gemmatimonadota bacterium]
MIRLLLLVLTIGIAAAAEATTLAGYIRNAADGEEVGLSVVALPGLQLGGLANERGYFAIRNVPAGRHLLVVSHIGYQSYRDSVDVADDVLLEIRLRREAIMGDETVITADRDAEAELERVIQTSFLTLAPELLQQLPATGEADLLRSLQLLPGIQAASDISSGLYVRGGGPDQTLILLDDIPLYNPSHAFGFFSTFNPEAVRDVQLYKGAYPANYGGNLGAVLDVSNRDGNREKTSLSGGVSLVSTRLLAEGPVGEGSWMMSGRRTYLDPLLAAIRSSGTDVPNYFFYDLNAKITQPLGDGGDNLLVSAYFGRDDLDFDLNEAETF